MKEKDTFILKKEWIDNFEMLEKEEILTLLRAICSIQKQGDAAKIKKELQGPAKICFGFMSPFLELAAANYIQTCEKNKKNGKLGGRKKTQSPPVAPSGGDWPPVAPSGGDWPPVAPDPDSDSEKKESSSSLSCLRDNTTKNMPKKTDDDDEFFSGFSKENQELILKWEKEFDAKAPLQEPDLINKIRRMLNAKTAGRLKIKTGPVVYLKKCINDFEDLGVNDGSKRAEEEAKRTHNLLESLRNSGPGVAAPSPKLPESQDNPSSHPCMQGANAATATSLPDSFTESQAALNAIKFRELRAKLAGLDATPRPGAALPRQSGASRVH